MFNVPSLTGRFSFWGGTEKKDAIKKFVESMSTLQLAAYVWRSDHTAEALERYLDEESDPKQRELAVFQMLFLGCDEPAGKQHWENVPAMMLSNMREAEAAIRLLLPANHYDWGFWQNIVMWQDVPRDYPSSTFNKATCACVNRMAAIETVFADKISNDAVEVGIAFLIKLLTGCEMSDPVWEQSFRVAQQFVHRRQNKSLTVEEMTRLRESVLFDSPHLAYKVQKDMPSL